MVVRFYQRDSNTFAARTAGTTNTVQVSITAARHIKVDHVAHVRDVDPARGNVGGNQHIHAAIGQALNPFGTLNLRHFTFEIAVVDTGIAQHFCQFMHALTFAYEYDGTGCLFLLQQVFQQLNLMLKVICAVVPLVDLLTLTGRWRSGHFHRIFQQTFGEIFNGIPFKGCREQHCLVTPARFTRDVFDILGKAHVQHAVSFIENQRFHCAAVEVLFFYVLQQTACRRDNDILVFAEHFGVVHIRYAAGDGRDIQMGVRRQLTRVFGNLHRQFTGRGQDQNARRA